MKYAPISLLVAICVFVTCPTKANLPRAQEKNPFSISLKFFSQQKMDLHACLSSRLVVEELNLTSEQRESIKTFKTQCDEEVLQAVQAVVSPPLTFAKQRQMHKHEIARFQEQQSELISNARRPILLEFHNRTLDVLLSDQRVRLGQLVYTAATTNRKLFGEYQNSLLAKTLDLSDSEAQKLSEQALRSRKDFLERVNEELANSQQEVLDAFDEESRKRFVELFGEPIVLGQETLIPIAKK